jgi:hypothetical protein
LIVTDENFFAAGALAAVAGTAAVPGVEAGLGPADVDVPVVAVVVVVFVIPLGPFEVSLTGVVVVPFVSARFC